MLIYSVDAVLFLGHDWLCIILLSVLMLDLVCLSVYLLCVLANKNIHKQAKTKLLKCYKRFRTRKVNI